jgi:hypothetical protein
MLWVDATPVCFFNWETNTQNVNYITFRRCASTRCKAKEPAVVISRRIHRVSGPHVGRGLNHMAAARVSK